MQIENFKVANQGVFMQCLPTQPQESDSNKHVVYPS